MTKGYCVPDGKSSSSPSERGNGGKRVQGDGGGGALDRDLVVIGDLGIGGFFGSGGIVSSTTGSARKELGVYSAVSGSSSGGIHPS